MFDRKPVLLTCPRVSPSHSMVSMMVIKLIYGARHQEINKACVLGTSTFILHIQSYPHTTSSISDTLVFYLLLLVQTPPYRCCTTPKANMIYDDPVYPERGLFWPYIIYY